jgi:cbb3-type cytochrome oxidase subunit 3
MAPKLKSLLFLLVFILCSVLYYALEKQEKNNSIADSEHIVTLELSDMDDSENLDQEEK